MLFTPKCGSWRPAKLATMSAYMAHSHHTPADCKVCWEPCNVRVDKGVGRCGSCWETLLTHPADAVRESLLTEKDVPIWVLRRMAGDESVSVAMAAAQRLSDAGESLFAPASTVVTVGGALDFDGTSDDGWD
jgi:hypothetical protein